VAAKYTPLRVPIALLHAKVYSTSHRLERLVRLEPKKEVKQTFMHVDNRVFTGPLDARFVVPPLFDRRPFTRKFFVLTDGKDTVTCRVCDLLARTEAERGEHLKTCFHTAMRALDKAKEQGICIVCNEPLDEIQKRRSATEYLDIPLCGKDCLEVWDIWNPTLMVDLVDEELELERAAANKGK